jgi:asparagine synthase (glutamine-hydrolysing)
MCGLLFTNNPNINKKDFLNALSLMNHRGPDAPGGYFAYENFKLGHNRLKILDLDNRSNQPFRSADGRYLIILNGEIYNYQELAKQYNLSLRTKSDTEVLLELYAAKGREILNQLIGMFAFVILDTHTREIFAARDRLGVKPLYFSLTDDKIIFSSEISPILKLKRKTDYDKIGLRQYLKLRTFFNGHTGYAGISMFPAGHYFHKGKISCFWELPFEKKLPPEDSELRDLINSAVKYRLIADVPIGSFLSGGLDSTIVALLSNKPHTWTVGFDDCNEFEWARLAASRQNSVHTEVLISREEFVELTKSMVKQRREPLSVPNEVLIYKMAKEVKKENTVILCGEGADELFFGYDRIFKWANDNNWDLKEFSKRYSYGSHEDLEIVEDAISPFLHYEKAIDIVAAFFQRAHLHGLLRRLDYATMLNAVEARSPFLDHRMIERLAGVSFDYKMEDGVIKAPLKRIFKEQIPAEIINRKKIGFSVPLDSMPFPIQGGVTSMDAWLQFNLSILNIDVKDIL